MTTLHAQPYNRDAKGFNFQDMTQYQEQANNRLDAHGNIVEEFEIQFIDGDDAELFRACGIDQTSLNTWFDDVEFLQDHEKVSLYYLVVVAGYSLDQAMEKLDEPSIAASNLRDAAEELFDECWLPSIPESARYYIDYDKFARDCELGGDMVEFEYANCAYTCTNANGL